MKSFKLKTKSAQETTCFGEHLAKHFKAGDVVCLFGDLGTGKTTLIKGVAQGLKINQKKVNSPTFVLMNMYHGKLNLFHFDLYRLEGIEGIGSIGYDEFLYGDGVSVIEWADRLEGYFPEEYLKIELNHEKLDRRVIKLSAYGKRYETLVDSIGISKA